MLIPVIIPAGFIGCQRIKLDKYALKTECVRAFMRVVFCRWTVLDWMMVPGAGLEPARSKAPRDFKFYVIWFYGVFSFLCKYDYA